MHISRSYKRLKVRRLKIAVLAAIISLFFVPNYVRFVSNGDNYYKLTLNGENVGVTYSKENAEKLMLEARKEVCSKSDQLVFNRAELSYEGSEVLWGEIDRDSDIKDKMVELISKTVENKLNKAYEVKINDYSVILKDYDDVRSLLQAAIDKYDETGTYKVGLELNKNRELPVFSAIVNTKEEVMALETSKLEASLKAGFDADIIDFFDSIEPSGDLQLEDYDTGITSLSFKDDVEVTEVYVNSEQISDLDTAIVAVTEDEPQNEIYTVVAGDSLTAISIKVNIPLEDILAINHQYEDEYSILHIGDEIVITVEKPKLTVLRKEVMYYEENYSEDTIIHWDPDKYTSDITVLRQPSDGHRKVVAEVTFENGEKQNSEIIAQEVTLQAVAKEIEKGEKVPPTFIKPISGGRMTSTFGRRSRPTKGASTFHKGIDWGVPQGTPVYASCGGTVIKAGWGSGYGYCVFISHPDGKVTRYGHLSKVLVSAGQTVSQGQRIALSGNTGVSTGPHLHFEILVNGAQVNPFNYLK